MHITYMSMLLNTATTAFLKQLSICKPDAIYGRKSNFILTFLLEGCLVYQIYQVQPLQSRKLGLLAYKIMK